MCQLRYVAKDIGSARNAVQSLVLQPRRAAIMHHKKSAIRRSGLARRFAGSAPDDAASKDFGQYSYRKQNGYTAARGGVRTIQSSWAKGLHRNGGR